MRKENHPLYTTMLKVLEEWAMMLVDPIEEVAPSLFQSDRPIYLCEVHLRGVINGSVSIVAQHEFFKKLANNILGEPEENEHSMEECIDAFKEMGNVFAGNYITNAYGDDVVFELLHPEVTEISSASLKQFMDQSVLFAFIADDVPVATSFNIDRGGS